MTSNEYVTRAIKVRLVRRDQTQKDLARNSGVNESQLSRYFAGAREWPIKILDIIAPAMGWNDSLDVFRAAENEKASDAADAENQ